MEYGEQAEGKWRYVFNGTFDRDVLEDERVKPRGEFFTSERVGWLEPVEGAFQKKKITE